MRLKLSAHRPMKPAARAVNRKNPRRALAGGNRTGSEAMFRAIERAHSYLHKQGDDAFMTMLRRHYPCAQYFVETERRTMMNIGVSRMDAYYYSIIPSLARTCQSQGWGVRPSLKTLGAMSAYVRGLYLGVHVECFYLVTLNRAGHLICATLLQQGNVNSAPFYLRQLLAVALKDEAHYAVLVHNHPGGTRRPSGEDLRCTLRALEAFTPLSIQLLDHLIVAGRDVVSIRQQALLPQMIWTAARPGSGIAGKWLDGEA